MIEEFAGLVSQSYRLVQVASDAGLEPNWKTAALVAASWAALEAARRAVVLPGGCWVLAAGRRAWTWATMPKPLSAGEQALLDCLEGGAIEGTGDFLQARNGKAKCGSARVWIDDVEMSGSLSPQVLRRLRALYARKLSEHTRAKAELEAEAVRLRLEALTPARAVTAANSKAAINTAMDGMSGWTAFNGLPKS